jgi:sodium/hydrogen antiporter
MVTINIALLIIGGLVFFLGAVSQRVREWNLSEPLVALVAGFLLSPAVLGILIWNFWILELWKKLSGWLWLSV